MTRPINQSIQSLIFIICCLNGSLAFDIFSTQWNRPVHFNTRSTTCKEERIGVSRFSFLKATPSLSDDNDFDSTASVPTGIEDSSREHEQNSIYQICDLKKQSSTSVNASSLRLQNATSDQIQDDQSLLPEEPPPICRIVTRAGGRIPNDPSILPTTLYQSPYKLLDKLDAYYHAKSRKVILHDLGTSEDRPADHFNSMYTNDTTTTTTRPRPTNDATKPTSSLLLQANDTHVVPVLRQSLEDSGFELLSRRDLDLCESLNAGYLLRLSILPDVSELDPTTFQEFYPEQFHDNGTFIRQHINNVTSNNTSRDHDFLFDGRVLVYWRGYSEEVTRGRLLLPKLDYLQASIVQRSAAWLKTKLDKVEIQLVRSAMTQSRRFRKALKKWVSYLVAKIRIRQFAKNVRESLSSIESNAVVKGELLPVLEDLIDNDDDDEVDNSANSSSKKRKGSFKLGRYGGSRIRFVGSPNTKDALDPFTICEYNYENSSPVPHNAHEKYLQSLNQANINNRIINSTIAACEHDMYEQVNHNAYTCEYDAKMMAEDDASQQLPRMQLLERVSISNLVDVFTKSGRRALLKTIFSKSELVEPSYQEVVVIWRPLVKKDKVIAPPKLISEFADMFDIEGFDQPLEDEIEVPRGNLEIRLFEQVPMSNLPAVLPKTKLIFRPADAFLFDMISFITFALVLSSIRFDSSKLDLLALVSVVLWVLRTLLRYSNKLARYDLLVKTFLTSKISQRNSGAFKYLTYEAGSQRAIRAGLVHSWVLHICQQENSPFLLESESTNLTRSFLEQNCLSEVNELLHTDKEVQLDAHHALQELVDLNLLKFTDDGVLVDVKDYASSSDAIKAKWMELFADEKLSGKESDGQSDGSVVNGTTIDQSGHCNTDREVVSGQLINEDGDDGVSSVSALKASKDSSETPRHLFEGFKERRKLIRTALEKNGKVGWSKARSFMREKGEAWGRLRANLDERRRTVGKGKARQDFDI